MYSTDQQGNNRPRGTVHNTVAAWYVPPSTVCTTTPLELPVTPVKPTRLHKTHPGNHLCSILLTGESQVTGDRSISLSFATNFAAPAATSRAAPTDTPDPLTPHNPKMVPWKCAVRITVPELCRAVGEGRAICILHTSKHTRESVRKTLEPFTNSL